MDKELLIKRIAELETINDQLQAELRYLDELLREAGFEKIDMEIDPWGIFTVSVARRVGR